MGVYQGYKGKVTIGIVTVGSMTKWNLPGMKNQILESTEFADTFKKFVYGITEGGKAEFSGWWDGDDSTASALLKAAWAQKTNLTTVRFYYGSADKEFFHLIPGGSLLVEDLQYGDVDITGLIPVKFTLQITNGYMEPVYNYYHATDISFAHVLGAGNDTINKTGGTTFASYFLQDQQITVEGSTSNDGSYTIATGGVAANALTLDEDTLTSEIAGDEVSLMTFPII